MIEAGLAKAAVGFLVSKVADGALQSAGQDAYKISMEKLKGFFSYKFAGKTELSEVHANPNQLVALVTEQATNDSEFKIELEKIVRSLNSAAESLKGASSGSNKADYIADFDVHSVSGGTVSGRDAISGNQVSGGTSYIGGDQSGGTFQSSNS
jgi:hypothetical protein